MTMMTELADLYQEIILEHSHSPRNFRALPNATRTVRGNNPLCGDQVIVYVDLDRDVIRDLSFQGSGCAISKASASVMTTLLKGRTRAEARELFGRFQDLVKTGDSDVDLGKLGAFAGVHKFPARVKCAVLAWHAMASALEGETEIVSTE